MDDDPLAWSVLEQETAYSCPGFDVIREIVSLPNGTTTDFDYVTEPPSVVILPFTETGDVVVVDEWRQAVGRRNRGLPAGTQEPADDTLAVTARRELREETGYEPDEIRKLGTFEPANGLAAIEHHYFLATDCTRVGEPMHDADETIRVDVTPWDELYAAALDGTLTDGRTVLGLLYYNATNAGR